MHIFERYKIQGYIRNVMRGFRGDPDTFEPECDFASERGRGGLATWTRVRDLWKAPAIPRPNRVSALERRLAWIGSNLRLGELDQEILGCVVRAKISDEIYAIMAAVDSSYMSVRTRLIARMLGKETATIRHRLTMLNPLVGMGLFSGGDDDDFEPSAIVMRLSRLESGGEAHLRAALFGSRRFAKLDWKEFDHLGPERELAVDLLAKARANSEKGLNLLFYGPPGTGKTVFANTLARRAGLHPVFVGEQSEDGEPSRSDRLAAYAIAQVMCGRSIDAVLVVDEADDIFVGVDEGFGFARRGSKVFTNRMLETSAVPTIWITNQTGWLGPTAVRRMSLAIRFPELSREKRTRVLARTARRRGLRLPANLIGDLVALKATPAVLDQSLRVAKLTHTGAPGAEIAARSILNAMGGAAPPMLRTENLDPVLWSADGDLSKIVQSGQRAGATALSFCFYGPPGTGKSAFARHLADKLGVDVLEKRASDLLSMWMGETEKQIARAFEEAADSRAMLIFDEADSLLRDRARAVHSWEITQVNEMLTWMERHPFPFVCTTNLMEALDPATLRRFLFKVRFSAMNSGQIATAFQKSFGCAAPSGLLELGALTPGDFAVVRNKAKVLGVSDAVQIAAWLKEEVALKPEARVRPIGFLKEGHAF